MASNTVTRKTTYRVTAKTRFVVSAFTEDFVDGQLIGQGSSPVGTFDNEGQANLIAKSLAQYQPEKEHGTNLVVVRRDIEIDTQAIYAVDESQADELIASLREADPNSEWRKARLIRD